MKKWFKKIGSFLKRHKWPVVLVSLSLAVGGFFIWDTLTASQSYSFPEFFVAPEEEEILVKAPLSGVEITENQSEKRPIAIVVENHPDARPHSGLLEADLVFETFAEGGITRFLAIYHSRESDEIGPVRSARTYFVDWALGYDAIFAHVGGSQEALNQVIREKVADINQFFNSSFFWRSTKRYAPHNVYTNTEKLRSAADGRGYAIVKNNIPALSFKEDATLELRPEAQIFKVDFNYDYGPTYTYNKECNCYNRSFASGKHMDISGEQVSAKNVAVLFSDMGSQKIRNNTYTIIDTVDSGKAYYYIDGKKSEGTWSRVSQSSPYKFYDFDGAAVEFNVGTTWIDVVPQGTAIK